MNFDFNKMSEELKNEVSSLIWSLLRQDYTIEDIAFSLNADSRSVRRWRDKECIPGGLHLEILRKVALV